MTLSRDIGSGSHPRPPAGGEGRRVVAAIGIDRYQRWTRLANAVRDAEGILATFEDLGFRQITRPLFNERATGKAIQALVTDELGVLGENDSLVLCYAGHGGLQRRRIGDRISKAGYLVPVDAAAPGKTATLLELEAWLRCVSVLPARHILVILDACYSGIALSPRYKARAEPSLLDESLATLAGRTSRRIITSANDEQIALDGGPIDGHSLFTGCLIEGLRYGIPGRDERLITVSDLAVYTQRQVGKHAGSKQTPDFGTFDYDDRGEMVIPLVAERAPDSPALPPVTAAPIADSGASEDGMSGPAVTPPFVVDGPAGAADARTMSAHPANPAWLVDVASQRLHVLASPTYVTLGGVAGVGSGPPARESHLHISAEGTRWYVTSHGCRFTTMNAETSARVALSDGQTFQAGTHRFVFRCMIAS